MVTRNIRKGVKFFVLRSTFLELSPISLAVLLYFFFFLVLMKNGVLRKLKHIFPNTYQRIKSIRSPAKGGTGCYRFNYQPGS